MKILVPIKRVVDANVNVRVRSDGSGVETANVKMSMNPFCEIAVEQAIRMKEAGIAQEIVVVSIGEKKCQETLRTALAMGADRAILIEVDADTEKQLQPLAIAKCLKSIVEQESPKLVISGKQSIDADNNQTGQMLAALLGWSQACFASNIELNGEAAEVTREIDGGLQTDRITLPAVITTDLRLNEPRYATLPNIMKSKKKPLDIVAADSLGVDLSPRVKVLKVEEPAKRSAGIKVANAAELVDKLKNEAKVI